MRRFFRIGLLVVLAVFVFRLFFLAEVKIARGSILVLELGGSYVETAEPPWLERALGANEVPLGSLLTQLALAERDERLAGVVLRVRGLGVGWAKAQEIRDAIARLSAKGRRTIAHLELEGFSSNLEYYVASAADEVFVSEATRAPLVGLAGEYLFLGGLFEKLGIELEMERVGAYKTAADMLTGREMSEAHREMANSLLDSINAQFVSGIASARKLDPALVRRAIDAAPVEPSELQGLGLIDGVALFEDLPATIGSGPVVEAAAYAGIHPKSVGFEPKARLAIIYGSGNVVSGSGHITPTGSRVLASETISKALKDAAEAEDIDAILLRINSPGGSALASDLIWGAAQRARAAGKPLVASFSDVAASGGYYVAAGADAIVAQPGSITGSIGVFVLRPVLAGAYEKLGIGVESLTRGAHADLMLASRPLSPASRRRLRRDVDSIYELFVERVAAGRPLDAAGVDAIARGRVWTGAQAHERGLVDELGGLRTAVERCLALAGIDTEADVELVPYPAPRPLAEQVAEIFGVVARASLGNSPFAAVLEPLEPWLRAAREREISALLPFSLEIR